AVMIGLGLEVGKIGKGKIFRIKDDGGAEFHEGANAEAVAVTGGVGMRKTGGLIVVAADDVGVESAMTVAALDGAAGVGGANKAIVDDAAGLSGIAECIETEMTGSRGAVIET